MRNRFNRVQIARNRRGAAVVEMAVVAPLLLIIAMGSLEATNAIHLKQSLEVCAYEGARVALLPGTKPENVKAACESMLVDRGVKDASVSISPTDFPNRPYGTEITVKVTAPLSKNMVMSMVVLRNKTIVSDVTMMKER